MENNYYEFRARDYRRIARDKLQGRWGISLAVTLLAGILGAFGSNGGANFDTSRLTLNSNSINNAFDFTGSTELPHSIEQLSQFIERMLENPFVYTALISMVTFGFLLGIALSFVGAATLLGHNSFYIMQCQNRRPEFKELFSRFRIFWRAVGLRYFMALFIFLWSLLLVVPGIIAGYRYAMAPYLMAQYPDMGIREAVNRSKELMYGHKWRLFCLQLSFIGWGILACFTLGIGFLWLNPYIYNSEAAFYLDRTGQGIPLNQAN